MPSDSFYLDVGRSIRSRSASWYRNVQFLGSGGNAVTFLILATSGANKGVLFAMKVFRLLSQESRRESFLRETGFLQTCSHPSIMRVYDDGVFGVNTESYPFVVAEYLPLTLTDVMRRAPTIAEKLSFTLQLLSALAYLENLDPPIVHRDIKPQNIFVKGKSCVLGDFGLMKRLDTDYITDREVYKESTGLGMPFFYRTPDLVNYAKNQRDLTTKTDVFQLGLVLAELFTGRNPCKPSKDRLGPVILERLKPIRGSLGNSISSLIEWMLDFNPDKRPSASLLLDHWQNKFATAVQQSHSLEGRVF